MARKMSRQAARSRIRRKDSDKIRPGVRKKRREIPQLAPGASPFRLRVARSPIQGFGVFALESIPKHHKVIEYTGKRMTVRAYDREQRNARSISIVKQEAVQVTRLNRSRSASTHSATSPIPTNRQRTISSLAMRRRLPRSARSAAGLP